jgi:hydroxymethylpyrimidine pyrophosphatase-like HAD family hydrolase/fructoselysine-6-P-deglycase FrlB-like protein
MGKPFNEEIKFLPQSISWALNQDITLLQRVIQGNSARQLAVVGSGGSFTAAAFLAQLHESFYGNISRAITPLEYISQQVQSHSNKAIAFISAEGKNKDILAAADASLGSVCSSFSLTLTSCNPLNKVCDTTGLATVITYDMPWIKDGYLATNSLIAIMILMARAYHSSENNGFNSLMSDIDDQWINSRHQQLIDKNRLQKLHPSRPIIILYGSIGRIAAIDLESKLAEASLAVCQICDYRQFAHGRHLQFAATETPLVIAFTSSHDELLSTETIKLFPTYVPVLKIELPEHKYLAEIIGTIDAILITKILADCRGIDPGQPDVPEFGCEMYNLDVSVLMPNKSISNTPAVDFKFGNITPSEIATYTGHGIEFCKRLESARFKAIVCDFDGTFCDTANRFKGMDNKLIPEFERLLSAGIIMGFATGRGDSLYKDLREKIDASLRSKVILGLYSGSIISSLESPIPSFPVPDDRFQALVEWLESIGLLQQLATKPKIECAQMGIRISNHSACIRTLAAIRYWIKHTEKTGWRAFCSGHSIDIITENAGKANVINAIASQTDSNPQNEILRIGDSGDFDGNDFELLNAGLSLSVGSVSPLPHSCWNLLPKDYHAQIGTLYYLSSLEVIEGRALFTRSFIEQAKNLISSN